MGCHMPIHTQTYTLWLDESNYTTITNRWHAQQVMFPFNLRHVNRARAAAEHRLRTLYSGAHVTVQDIEFAVGIRNAVYCDGLSGDTPSNTMFEPAGSEIERPKVFLRRPVSDRVASSESMPPFQTEHTGRASVRPIGSVGQTAARHRSTAAAHQSARESDAIRRSHLLDLHAAQ